MQDACGSLEIFHTLMAATVSNGYLEETYRKIPNISPGLKEVRKHFLGGLYSGGLIFGGHVLVSQYQDLKVHCCI